MDDVLRLSESVEPSVLLGTGGVLFDQFFLSQGSVTCKQRLNSLMMMKAEDTDDEDEEDSDEVS